MKIWYFIAVLLFAGFNSYSQSSVKQFIGLNLLQLPSSTINANYSIDYKPYLTPVIDLGYTFNYNYKYDIGSYYIAPKIDMEDGYTLGKQSGGYLKIGSFINLSKNFEKQNFFHIGLFLTNSIVYEKGSYQDPLLDNPDASSESLEHMVFLIGLNTSIGYEFRISDHLKSNVNFQVSFPTNKYMDLYGIGNYIPGMGYSGSVDRWIPMLMLTLKYEL